MSKPCFYAIHGINYKNGFVTSCPIQVDNLHLLDGSVPSEFINNEGFKDHRKRLWNGEYPWGCLQCQETENDGSTPMRNDKQDWMTTEYFNKETGEIDFKSIQHIEIRFNNSCNMACLHCDSVFSSGWETKLKKYKPDEEDVRLDFQQLLSTRHRPQDKSIKLPRIAMGLDEVDRIADDLIQNFPNIRQFDCSGGEPLKQREYLHLLDRLSEHPNAKGMTAMFYTNFNADFDPIKLSDKLKKFRDAIIHISVDAGTNIYSYFRDGEWDKLKSNINAFNEVAVKGRLSAVITTSIYQVMDIYNVFESVMELDVSVIDPAIVVTPSYINPAILMNTNPDELISDIERTRQMILNKIEEYGERKHHDALRSLEHIEEYVVNHIPPLGDTERFLKYTKKVDKLFNKNFNNHFPNYQLPDYKDIVRT
jgi:organic radical activating enzyme